MATRQRIAIHQDAAPSWTAGGSGDRERVAFLAVNQQTRDDPVKIAMTRGMRLRWSGEAQTGDYRLHPVSMVSAVYMFVATAQQRSFH